MRKYLRARLHRSNRPDCRIIRPHVRVVSSNPKYLPRSMGDRRFVTFTHLIKLLYAQCDTAIFVCPPLFLILAEFTVILNALALSTILSSLLGISTYHSGDIRRCKKTSRKSYEMKSKKMSIMFCALKSFNEFIIARPWEWSKRFISMGL